MAPRSGGGEFSRGWREARGGRGAMAAHYAISPAEDDAVIRQRLLTRTTTTRGEPPLKKLIKRFTALVAEVDREDSEYSECEKLYKSFLQELATFELPLLKSKAVVDANRREQESFKELHVQLNQQISQVWHSFVQSWILYSALPLLGTHGNSSC